MNTQFTVGSELGHGSRCIAYEAYLADGHKAVYKKPRPDMAPDLVCHDLVVHKTLAALGAPVVPVIDLDETTGECLVELADLSHNDEVTEDEAQHLVGVLQCYMDRVIDVHDLGEVGWYEWVCRDISRLNSEGEIVINTNNLGMYMNRIVAIDI